MGPRAGRGRAGSRRRHGRGGRAGVEPRPRLRRACGPRTRRGRARRTPVDLPRARRTAQGAGQAPRPDQGRVLRPVAAHRCHPARLDGRHRRRHRHPVLLRQQGHPRAAQRHDRARRQHRGAGPRRHVRRSARLHLAPRCGGPDQRLQLPRLGDAREARTRLPRRPPQHRQAGQPDRLPHRGRRPPDRRVGDPAGRQPAARLRQRRDPARRAHRAGLGRLHRLGPHRSDPAQPPGRAPARCAPGGRGGLAELLDPRPGRDCRTTRSSTSSSRESSPR